MALAQGAPQVWQVPAAGLEGATLPVPKEGSAAKILEAPGTSERGARGVEDGRDRLVSGTAAAAVVQGKD